MNKLVMVCGLVAAAALAGCDGKAFEPVVNVGKIQSADIVQKDGKTLCQIRYTSDKDSTIHTDIIANLPNQDRTFYRCSLLKVGDAIRLLVFPEFTSIDWGQT